MDSQPFRQVGDEPRISSAKYEGQFVSSDCFCDRKSAPEFRGCEIREEPRFWPRRARVSEESAKLAVPTGKPIPQRRVIPWPEKKLLVEVRNRSKSWLHIREVFPPEESKTLDAFARSSFHGGCAPGTRA